MSKQEKTDELKLYYEHHDKDDGFDFLCMLERREKFHGDLELAKTCKALLEHRLHKPTDKTAHK